MKFNFEIKRIRKGAKNMQLLQNSLKTDEASLINNQTPPSLPQKGRDSGIELFRIIAMLLIVAHHYVVNSGLLDLVAKTQEMTMNSIFLLIYGAFGKIGINWFVMITGYFMCKQTLTVKKFLKLFLQVEFYKLVTVLFVISSGYKYSLKTLFAALTPFYGIGRYFTPSIVVFFLFIPFLNKLIGSLDKKMHERLIVLCVSIFTLIPSLTVPPLFIHATVTVSDLGWFSSIYFIASYIRLYPTKWFNNQKLWQTASFFSLLLVIASVLGMAFYMRTTSGIKSPWYPYFFISPSNKLLALIVGISVFMFFKNLKMKQSYIINTIAASSFGVLLIHTSSEAMRKWLWYDFLKNTTYFNADLSALFIHAICSVLGIYIFGTLFDMARIKLIEKPVFNFYDKWAEKKR